MKAFLGTRKGLIILDKKNGAWEVERTAFAGVPISYAMQDPRNGTIWAALDHGHWGTKLHRPNDGGENWEEIEAPKFPEGSQLADGSAATVRYIWSMSPGGIDQPDRFYIGTEPGGLFRSDDGGKSFQLVESLWNHPSRPTHWFGGGRDHPGIHSIFVDPRDSDRVLVAISCAGVFETTDGGKSWEPINRGLRAEFLPNPEVNVGHDPHLMVASRANPDALWQQNHCGIYYSPDGGRNWQDVSDPTGPARFGFTVAVDDQRPERAWVVPAEADERRMAIDGALCVCRTDDGGTTWQTLRDGLPQANCYDVVFRHALDARGSDLLFGSTTGNVFASSDGGDSWNTVGTSFPPVYSIRMA